MRICLYIFRSHMPKLKSARHHWWPECVSAHWAAEDGMTGWIQPDGTCRRVHPKQLGVIGNALIGVNMRHSQRLVSDTIGSNGKFVVLFSQGREFIFGDGFFHNVRAIANPPISPKILAPITPRMSVLVARPPSFTVQPRLLTIVLSDEEVDRCNHAVQVYSRQALYFRSDRPTVEEVFTCNEYRQYASRDNPIDNLIYRIPGVPPRDRSFDFLMSTAR
jgi:hypothetical protein